MRGVRNRSRSAAEGRSHSSPGLQAAVPGAEILLFGAEDMLCNLHAPNERLVIDELRKTVIGRSGSWSGSHLCRARHRRFRGGSYSTLLYPIGCRLIDGGSRPAAQPATAAAAGVPTTITKS